MSSNAIGMLGHLVTVRDAAGKQISIPADRVEYVEDGNPDGSDWHVMKYRDHHGAISSGKIHTRYYEMISLRYVYGEPSPSRG